MYLSYKITYKDKANYLTEHWTTGKVSQCKKYLVNEQGVAMKISYFKKFDHVYHDELLSKKELNQLLNNK